MSLTIAYITNRREPYIHWFFDSLRAQAGAGYGELQIVVVDHFKHLRGDRPVDPNVRWVAPKPTPWAGEHRLAQIDYFAAANARNTAICHAKGNYIAFVDDLSVLIPGWLDHAKAATRRNEITLGRYRKVNDLKVENGLPVLWTEGEAGRDSRYQPALGQSLVRCPGSWLYGSSLVMPIEALLTINGFDEDCDSMGTEDTAAGVMLENSGYGFVYDQGMFTLESEELHFVEKPFYRMAKPYVAGVSRFHEQDAAHAHLAMLRRGRNRAPNTFDLEELRGRILAGGDFSTDVSPQHDWRDYQPISEMNGETVVEYLARHDAPDPRH